MAPPIVGKIVAYFFAFVFITLVCTGIIMLIRNITCTQGQPANVYEHFDDSDDYLKNLKTRITNAKQANDTLQNDLDILNDNAEDTCEIMSNVEDMYVSSRAAPSDDSDLSLPREEQQKKMDRRRDRAKKNFQLAKDTFVKSNNNQKLLECFASVDNIEDAEQDLNDAIGDLTKTIDGAEMQLAIAKGKQTWFSLLFNAPYLKKAINITTAKPSENFDNQTGGLLLSKADELIGKANTIHNVFLIIIKSVKDQKTVAGALAKKNANLQNGNIEQGDVNSATANIAASTKAS